MSAYDITGFLRTAYRPFAYCVPSKHHLNTAYQKGGVTLIDVFKCILFKLLKKLFLLFLQALAAYNSKHQTDVKELKPPQQKALDALLNGADCICCLPTGFGKSLIYEILPFCGPKFTCCCCCASKCNYCTTNSKAWQYGYFLIKRKKYIQMKLLMAGLGIYSHTQKIS